jgi:hypothetical protein
MALKRRPPKGNARRAHTNSHNKWGVATNQRGETVQFESGNEDVLLTTLLRKKGVVDVISQPIDAVVPFHDDEGKFHTYTPDYMVIYLDGRIEIHEFSMTATRLRFEIRRREEAARQFYKKKGWVYIVHTEYSLPSRTEQANLHALAGFRPTEYRDTNVAQDVLKFLSDGELHRFDTLAPEVARIHSVPRAKVNSTVFHMMWHQEVEFNPQILIFIDGSINSKVKISLGAGTENVNE